MSRTAYTINVSGWVLFLAGLTLIIFPEEVRVFFWKDDDVQSFWLRTLGYFFILEGLICYKSSFYEITDLYRWMMNIRIIQPAFFGAMLIVDFANPGLMLYSTAELILGLWTFSAYKKENN